MMEMVVGAVGPMGAADTVGAVGAVNAAGTLAGSSVLPYAPAGEPCEPERGHSHDAAAQEALHLDAADALLRRYGWSLASCEVSRECASLDAGDDAVLYVVRVGGGVDTFALNEALTALQLARGLTPSPQLDVVFQP